MRYQRMVIPGATYFFTINLLNRKSSLLIENIEKLRLAFQTVRNRYPFEINAIAILPDHFHIMMTLPQEDGDYSLRLRLIKGSFSHRIDYREYVNSVRKKKKERGIWQRRFWEHLIRDEKDYEQHFNYIHYNPVKHGYVNQASAWPYSSINRAIKSGLLPENWAYNPDCNNENFGE